MQPLFTKQTVDTGGIESTAGIIRTRNSNINQSFNSLKNKMNQLNDWSSPAGETARTTWHGLANHNNERSTILENYHKFLIQQVNPGYVRTETANTSLAEKFK